MLGVDIPPFFLKEEDGLSVTLSFLPGTLHNVIRRSCPHKKDHRRTRIANAYFSLFMAAGNILGCATGSFSGWYKIFPFTLTDACAVNCANLKTAFLLDIIFIAIATYISLSVVKEQPLDSHCNEDNEQPSIHGQKEAFLWELFGTFKYFPATVWVVLLVTTLTWIAWFPFTLFDTDWVAREIYGGEPNGTNYSNGVRMGSLGLMLNSMVMGVTSVFMEKLCGKWGPGFAWGVSNIVLSLCFIAMLVITAIRNHMDIGSDDPPPNAIVIAVLLVFTTLGVPLSITYSVPYALISSQIENLGLGQGLSMGVLNLAIVVPQILVSVGSGGWDELFGGGNSPAFFVAAISAFAAGLVASLALPRTRIHKQNHLP